MGRLDKNLKIQPHMSVSYKETDYVEAMLKYKLLDTAGRPVICFEKAGNFSLSIIKEYRNKLIDVFHDTENRPIYNYIMDITANKIFDISVMMFYVCDYIKIFPEIIKFFDWFIKTAKIFNSTDIAFAIYKDTGQYKDLINILKENVSPLFNITKTTYTKKIEKEIYENYTL